MPKKNDRTILVVEDDHDTRVSIRSVLEQEGYFVLSATNGMDALELLEKASPPAVILLDLNMPKMGGEDFLQVLRALEPLKKIPVIQMSAMNRGPLQGVQGTLPKPIDLKLMIETIEKARTCTWA